MQQQFLAFVILKAGDSDLHVGVYGTKEDLLSEPVTGFLSLTPPSHYILYIVCTEAIH